MGKFLLVAIILFISINIVNAAGALKVDNANFAAIVRGGFGAPIESADTSGRKHRNAFTKEGTPGHGIQLKIIPLSATPVITAGNITGNINGCSGVASGQSDILQIAVSGANLTGDITASITYGFDISVSRTSGYASSLVISPSNGTVNTIIYMRSSAVVISGGLTSELLFTSPGAANLNETVKGVVNVSVVPSVYITASADKVCTGTLVTFTAEPTNGGDTPSYQWQINGANAGDNNRVFTSSTLATGDVVRCVLTSNARCSLPANATSNSITMTVSTPAAPSVNIAASANNVCSGTPVTFTATPTNGVDVTGYQWLVNGNHAGTDDVTFTSSTLGNGDVVSCVLNYSTPCTPAGTVTSNGVTMIIGQSAVVSAGGDKTISAGGSTTLNATATGDIADITWSPATGLSNNKILNPVASPAATTTYTLVVKTTDGCVFMDNVTIEVLLPIVVPNSFTPNNDGINDTWNIKYLDVYSNCTVKIVNRWGQTVYSSTGYGTPWNGLYKGTVLPTGTYYYVIDLKQNTKPLSGYVAIIR